MSTLKVTAKGQITLRQDLLRHLNVIPGQHVEAEKLPDGRIVVRASSAKGSMDDFIGSLAEKGGRTLSVEEIGEIAAEGWAGKR